MIRSPHTKALANEWLRQTQWGYCPFCLTNQDMLEHMGTCTKCDEPLEEGSVEE